MFKAIFSMALAAGLALATGAAAHGPSRQKTQMTITLDASPAEVWDAIGKFDDMGWHPAVASTEITPEGAPIDVPDESTRILHLKSESGDPTITEQLMKIDPDKMMYKYMITEVAVEVLPVTNYSATIQVSDNDGKAEVMWKGGYYRGYPNNDPPENLNDEAAIAAVTAIYQAGFDALAERFGKVE
ncbi:SRPBCC family protein [Paracoccus sp. Z330]|uniref:SRPBCC family protein n=1 Tax=Paracoccus onchidii TaxID=3017813 RepID=A0ABT4ZFP0_9RHOB|nr:SRPBCC family protein [Paracoccus onchidii]MDB6178183.1 SRPBCC family protein [Paracoccus onchidii]